MPINEDKMNELVLADRAAEWRRLKSLVLDSVSSPITRRVYSFAVDEFIAWFGLEPRRGFTKATVKAWRGRPWEFGVGSGCGRAVSMTNEEPAERAESNHK